VLFLCVVQRLKGIYEGMISDLKKIHEVYMFRKGGSDFSWERRMTELVTNMLEYMSARRDMIDLYPKNSEES